MAKHIVFIANRLWLILTIYACSILAAAFLFMLLENREFHEGLWWAVITALTIGYGDIAPVTGTGRIMGGIFGHFWIFAVIPMIIANIIVRLIEDKNEFTDAEQKEMMRKLKNIESLLSKEDNKT